MRPYHALLGALGVGDLHPGGEAATLDLLDRLDRAGVRRVLEVGAGRGHTTRRMVARGWDVTALEPNAELAGLLAAASGRVPLQHPVEALDVTGAFDAAIAESVLYGTRLPAALAAVARALVPGGRLAFTDMVWTARATAPETRRLAAETREAFGIAMASAEPWTWPDWREMLAAAGFDVEHERCLGPGSPGAHSGHAMRTLVANPGAVVQLARYNVRARRIQVPPGWLESWTCIARKR